MMAATRTTPELLRRAFCTSLLYTFILAVTPPAHAAQGIPWSELSKQEQSVLGKHRSDWSSLGPARQKKLRQGARQYLELSPEKRQAVERKHNQYEKMSPREREKLRNKYYRQKSRD